MTLLFGCIQLSMATLDVCFTESSVRRWICPSPPRILCSTFLLSGWWASFHEVCRFFLLHLHQFLKQPSIATIRLEVHSCCFRVWGEVVGSQLHHSAGQGSGDCSHTHLGSMDAARGSVKGHWWQKPVISQPFPRHTAEIHHIPVLLSARRRLRASSLFHVSSVSFVCIYFVMMMKMILHPLCNHRDQLWTGFVPSCR